MGYMLTTSDNPYDPRINFDAWFAFDMRAGYNTPGYLARLVNTSYELSEADQDIEIENAIDAIIRENPTAPYMKLKTNDLEDEDEA